MNSQPAVENLLKQEMEAPVSHRVLFDRLGQELPHQAALLEFLSLKVEQTQRSFHVRSERAWFRRFVRRIIRPFLAVALLASVGFAVQRRVDPLLGLMLFLAGAATLYAVILVSAMLWANRDRQKLADFDTEYRSRLEEQLARLRRAGSNPG